jgi:hypothetical protein
MIQKLRQVKRCLGLLESPEINSRLFNESYLGILNILAAQSQVNTAVRVQVYCAERDQALFRRQHHSAAD